MNTNHRLWRWLGLIFVLSFGALGYLGRQIYLAAPPIPQAVVTTAGDVLFTGEQIQRGQQAWLAAGGQQLGTVWGHGSYVAPDWSADWLHREATALQAIHTQQQFGSAASLTAAQQAAVDVTVKEEMRRNTYDAACDSITVSKERARAIHGVAQHFEALFGTDPSLATLRDRYAMATGALPDQADREALAAFFFWTSWAAATDRPGETDVSYTSNWPHEPLVGNTMTSDAAMWSMVSIILLLAGIAAMLWLHGSGKHEEDAKPLPADPFLNVVATPSMKATRKYFFAVIGLILVQIGMGAITAHYAVEGEAFFGIPLAQVLPYVISRTVHTQLGVLWIATAWLATGLYIAPLLSGREPKFQKLGVDLLFWALIFIVVGSIATGWLGTLQHRGADFGFWIGNQGLEYTSMGRVWQLLLFVGLLFWVALLGRALWPALKTPSESRGLIAMVFLSATCIGGFYSTSLVWGQHTHYSMIEYWRWWLVHLWVEGFFEVFATAVVALLFTRLGLVRAASANRAIVAETIVFLFGGILGTLHHLYFTGTPTSIISVGAVFSALEVVPLTLIGLEALQTLSPHARHALARRLQVAGAVLRGRGLLEHGRRGPAGLCHQPAGLAVLRAGPEHDGRPRARRAVRGVRHAGHRPDAVLPARPLCAQPACRPSAQARVLGPEHRPGDDGVHVAAAGRHLPGLGQHHQGHVVRPLAGSGALKLMETLVWLRVPGDIVFAGGAFILALYALRLLRRPPSRQAATAPATATR